MSVSPGDGKSAAIDRSILAEISGGDQSIERRMLLVFLKSNDADAAALKQAIARQDVAAVTRVSHRLMGASRIVGAVALAKICEKIEQAGLAGDRGAIVASGAAFDREIDRVSVHLGTLDGIRPSGLSGNDDELPAKLAGINFLVVEDHDFQREALVCTLAGLGARHIVEAVDGRAALAVIQEQPIDVIISDLEMPGMDGMEFIRHVSEAGALVSMILSSVHDRALLASVGTMTEAYGVNLLGTIEKPATRQKLEALLKLYRPPATPQPAPARVPVSFSEADISAALAARLFEPLFQPKVNVATGRLVGAEALARWRHPERGMVGPYAFIPALEANRRIDELTWIMLEKAAVACRDWRAAGLDVTVAVNLSLGSLTQVGLADRITGLIQAQSLEPKHMVLEVTETIAMTDIARALENLARLRIRGFGLSIDDYGTGYSSMQQLSRIPFTELKIDQSFVMGAIEKDSCRVILESSLDIARKLGLKAVAEGVETRADWELLKRLDCDVAQGYFIARPMEAAKLAEWADAWRPPG